MKEISSRILFPSAVFRFTDNSCIVQLIQSDESGQSMIIAENSFAKLKEAVEYYMTVCKDRQASYEASQEKTEEKDSKKRPVKDDDESSIE